MKKAIKTVLLISLLLLVYIKRDFISSFIIDEIIYKRSNKVLTYNEYYLDNDFLYVQNIDNDKIKNYQDLLNIFYTIINSGDNSFTFTCDYNKCLDDVKKLTSDDNTTISTINNFVHPYNSFSTINVDTVSTGLVTVTTNKLYSNDQIKFIDDYITKFIDNNINDSMSITDKIRVFHDYVINNTVYSENDSRNYTAYALIKEGKSICGGYSDIMAIYLDKLGIKNYKITSENHVWNYVFVDNNWYHLDLTWDDPIASDGNQYLLHNFFLITTDKLLELDDVEHNFDKNIYLEK